MPTYRHWCATFFNEPSHPRRNGDGLRYLIVGEETAPTTGRKHWQCYMEFQEKTSMKKIKEIFNDNTVHLEPKRGSREQARDYCKKEGTYKEHGVWATGPGFRTDLVDITSAIISREARLTDIIMEQPEVYCRHRNGLRDVQALADKKNTKEFRQVEVEVISGPTGTGKTRRAVEHCKDYFKIEASELQWFDGYDGEKTLIIDEYNNDVPITRLLNILDGYQLRLPIKGGFTYARWDKVFITTNLKRSELHERAKDAHRAALERRVTTWTSLWTEGDEEVGVVLNPTSIPELSGMGSRKSGSKPEPTKRQTSLCADAQEPYSIPTRSPPPFRGAGGGGTSRKKKCSTGWIGLRPGSPRSHAFFGSRSADTERLVVCNDLGDNSRIGERRRSAFTDNNVVHRCTTRIVMNDVCVSRVHIDTRRQKAFLSGH